MLIAYRYAKHLEDAITILERVEPMEVKRLGNLYGENKGTGFAGNVWDSDGLCPTITTMQGGGREPMIVENVLIGGMQEHQAIKKDGVCTTLTSSMGTGGGYVPMMVESVRIKQATKEGYIECKVGGVADLSYPGSTTRRGRVQKGGDVCPTLTATETGVCRIEKVGQISSEGSQYGTVISDSGISANLVAGTHGYANNHIMTNYRIRKLTPKECWRLMGFTDEDFHKAEKVNSNTQLYKQAGNSIVVSVLEAIFGQMIDAKIKKG